MYLLCLYHAEVWPVPHRSPELQTQDTPQCQTKHEVYVGVGQGQPEKNARSWGVSRSVRVAVVPWPLSRWPVGSLLTRTEDWRGRGRERFAAKRRTCFVVLPNQSHNTLVQVAAEGKRVCLLGLCVGTPLSLSYPQPRSVWINFARKASVLVLKEGSHCDKLDNQLYADS